MAIHIHNNDLPENLDLGTSIAIDTETMGLNPHRDRLCLVQLSSGNGMRTQKVPRQRRRTTFKSPFGTLPDQIIPFCSV